MKHAWRQENSVKFIIISQDKDKLTTINTRDVTLTASDSECIKRKYQNREYFNFKTENRLHSSQLALGWYSWPRVGCWDMVETIKQQSEDSSWT